MVRRKHIRATALRLLDEHHILTGPIDVMTIAGALGAEVQESPAEGDLSGFLYRDHKKNVAIIGVNSNHHPNRRNFTIAHELGHFLLHDFPDIHVDRGFNVWMRDAESSKGYALEEKEANLFAAELLMPWPFVKRDVEALGAIDLADEQALQDLAAKYRVSVQAMSVRLAYLGYVQQ